MPRPLLFGAFLGGGVYSYAANTAYATVAAIAPVAIVIAAAIVATVGASGGSKRLRYGIPGGIEDDVWWIASRSVCRPLPGLHVDAVTGQKLLEGAYMV